MLSGGRIIFLCDDVSCLNSWLYSIDDPSRSFISCHDHPPPPTAQSILPKSDGNSFPNTTLSSTSSPTACTNSTLKKSTFMHGTEGDDGKPCLGQQEIHQKITAIGFQDCKVFIHSVDAQSSADGGIIIQVIGEMSNRSEPWRKFVQTFFLAEQPNGYFVLNDIFRFLKEESVDDESSDVADSEPVVIDHPAVSLPEPPREPTPPPPPPAPEREPTPPPVETEPEPVPEPPAKAPTPEPPAPAPVQAPATPQPNGVHRADTPATAPTPPVEKAPTPTPAPAPAAAAPTPPPAAAPAPAAPAPAPVQPAQPQQPKTWANLAAANSKKWGAAVAQDSRGTSEVATSAPIAPAAPPPAAAPQRSQQGQHPNYIAAMTVQTPQCFVKGVIEPVTSQMLTTQLTARFGPMKDLEIVRSKACAFFEFNNLDAARRAIAASLPPNQGGEGGFWVECGDGVTQRISIETRKERGDRPPSRPRGGGPMGEGRGGEGRGRGGDFRGGRGRGAGAGRGAPPGK
ncbi:NTF2 domain-containing protein [Mycena kentingensis (nom. inval.)]|nr:NTF2 domain-containing protein [Mycena kentingensis (nom. inval.)]